MACVCAMLHKMFHFPMFIIFTSFLVHFYIKTHTSPWQNARGIKHKKEKQNFMAGVYNGGNTERTARDWTGNTRSVFVCNGASNHTKEERQEDDYYATEPRAVGLLLSKEHFNSNIWECACGEGHLSDVLKAAGYTVFSSDIVDRGYKETEIINFLEFKEVNSMDIITNPPYKYAKEFVKHALDMSVDGTKIAMFLKLTFLESQSRKELFREYPFRTLYVSSARLQCAKNGEFEKYRKNSTAVAYGWYVWVKGFKGKPVIEWI